MRVETFEACFVHHRYVYLIHRYAADKIQAEDNTDQPGPMAHLMYEWHGKEYFAVAHGLSGILMVLLMQPNLLAGLFAMSTSSSFIPGKLASFVFFPLHSEFRLER